MRKRNVFRRFLIVLAFVVLPLTTYFTVSHVTSCQAQTCACAGGTCIPPNAIVDAFNTNFHSYLQPALGQARDIMVAAFEPLTRYFYYGIKPVIDWTIWKLTYWFQIFWSYNLQPSMRLMTAELTVANQEQNFSVASFVDGVNFNRKKWAIDDTDLENHREQRPSGGVCTAATLVGGMTQADRLSDAFHSAASGNRLWRTSNHIGTTAEGGTNMDTHDRWQRYLDRFCRRDYNAGNSGCEDESADKPFADKDMDVVEMIFGRDTIPLDHDQDPPPASDMPGETLNNLNQLIDNLAEPFIKDPIAAGGSAGRYALLASQSYKAKRQVVYDSLDFIVSRRVPAGLPQAYIDSLKELRSTTNEELTTSSNPSRYEIMRALMTQRFRSGRYSLSQIDEPENNQRELVIEQALQMMQMSDQLDLLDHYSLLLASQVSTEVMSAKVFGSGSAGVPLK